MPMVLVCFGVFQCANYWCAHLCELGDVWRYKNPSLVKKIMKDLLDPGEFMFTAGSVQVLQVKVAEVYLVMEANEEDVPIFLLGFMEAWWFLWWALVKFASLEPRSVWTNNQGVLKYACDSRLRLVCQWVCTFLHVPAVGMVCGKSQELTLAAILDARAITCWEL